MKIAFFSTKSYDKTSFGNFVEGSGHEITFFELALSEITAPLAGGFDAVCVFVNDKLDEKTIGIIAEQGVKVIALRCAGFNNVDLEAAKKHELKVVRVPAYSPEAVAEHALALMMTLNRKTHKAFNRIRENNFSIENLTGFNLHGKTVGVIGTGLIGSAFIRIMRGFGCSILASDVRESEELKSLGVTYVPVSELLSKSDVISLHCPLLPDTHHLINAASLDQMKDGVMLINTSRGGLVNTGDAIDALKTGKLGYLGIDVYEQEAGIFFKDSSETILQDDVIARLMTFPNVLITGHQGFLTHEALEQIAKITLQNLSDFERGVELKNKIF
ncbi:2-hydroxyacid dehydrogenase [Emticicia sp. CRIBPO]|uniref:2-hydroxyacid dehydrogenase n=1 Tax=Emticicia sp. CRIBPO TaxID=2683258 RepID=UPI001411E8DC|nr:2-hydroxyacid dehydrogenase [Emticicia sp. CRIBPO]NBA86948.1 2-hydroxyacid dehydrogenase [Emticicia sp. CRIBPO]